MAHSAPVLAHFRHTVAASLLSLLALTGCDKDANVASRNLSNAADNFQIMRRVTFLNTRTNTVLLEAQGLCSLGNFDGGGRMSITCKTETGDYVKHFVGMSTDVTFVAQQLLPAEVSTSRYYLTIKVSALVPMVEFR